MEPVTHILTGACLARTGFNRRAAYATAVMAIAAEFPDIDTLWGIDGPIAGFEHHRGITHTFVGLPFEAAFLVLLFWLLHRWRVRRSDGRTPVTASPPRWFLLYGFVLLALGSHLLLDYTNNYGLRPFFPFDRHWYAASLVFIFDPLLFLFLLAGFVAPAIFSLVGREISGKRAKFAGMGWARAALCGMLLLWVLRWYEHGRAVDLAQLQTLRAPAQQDAAAPETGIPEPEDSPAPATDRPLLRPLSVLASPDPLSPFRWYAATDFGPVYRLSTVETGRSSVTPGQVLQKQPPDRWVRAADATHLGRVYLDWSAMPWVTEDPVRGAANPGAPGPTVWFRDLRFMGDNRFLQHGSSPPLTGRVDFAPDGEVVDMSMDGRSGQ